MNKANARKRRASSLRYKLRNTLADNRRPVLTVHRTNQHVYAQVTTHTEGKSVVVATSSSLSKEIGGDKKSKTDLAALIGADIAKKSLEKGLKEVSFDRSGFKYHGVIKKLADSARESGLIF